MCCLKFFVSKIYLYCRYGAFVKTIFISGAPMVLTFFFHSNSFFISVSSVRRIFTSVFVGKFILPSSQKYVAEILYTYLSSICRLIFPILSSRLSLVLCASLSELWIFLSWLVVKSTGFLLKKDLFQSFLMRHF